MVIKSFPYDDPSNDPKEITSDILTPSKPEINVPTEVIQAIKDRIKELQDDVAEDGGTAIQRDSQLFSNNQEMLLDVIDKLEMLQHELSKKTEDGFKRAQIAWSQIPSYHWKHIPVVVSQFIYRARASNTHESLIDTFYTARSSK
jgi:hypothetical protein